MLTTFGRLTCTVGMGGKFLLRIPKLSGGLNRFCAHWKGMATVLDFHPCSVQSTTSLRASSVPNLISNPVVLYESRKLLHTTRSRYDVPLSEPDEKLEKAKEAVQKEYKEAKPTGLFAKLKYYLKRYWYIAIPIHIANCAVWFIVLYIAVKSGLDIISLLEKCHVPSYAIDKVKSVPPNAGVAVVAFLLYKIASPFRYASTLLLIQLSFPILRRLGIMTAKEVKYKMRLKYSSRVKKIKRRYQLKFGRIGSIGNKRRQSTGGTKRIDR